MVEVLLSARQLTKRFGGLTAVNGVSLDLWRGRIHAVIGPNGAGKSTLTNLLSGDLPPSSGQVHLGSTNITGWPPERISRQGLGRSYQKTNIFLPLTVHENVRLAAQSRDAQQPWNPLRWWQDTREAAINGIAANQRLETAITLSGLENRRTAIAGALSHGEQRQLEIAMTLATEPQVLLLDEHTAALDPKTAHKVLKLTTDIVAEHNLTTLMITHNMKDAIAIGNRLIMMNEGKIIYDVSGEEKKNLTTADLLAKFKITSGGEEFDNDRVLLSTEADE